MGADLRSWVTCTPLCISFAPRERVRQKVWVFAFVPGFFMTVIFSPTVRTSRDLRAAWQSRWAHSLGGSEGSSPVWLYLHLSPQRVTQPPLPSPRRIFLFFSVPLAAEPRLRVEPRASGPVPGSSCLSRAYEVPGCGEALGASAPAAPGSSELPRPARVRPTL